MYTVHLELVQVLSPIFGDSCKAEFSITICKLQNYGVIIVIHFQRLTAKENVFWILRIKCLFILQNSSLLYI